MKTGKQAVRDGKALFLACKVNGVVDEGRVRVASWRFARAATWPHWDISVGW